MTFLPQRSSIWQRSTALVLRLGLFSSTVLSTLVIVLVAQIVAHGVVTVTGGAERWVVTLAAWLATLAAAPPVLWLTLKLVFDLDRAQRVIEEQSSRDPLTGVFNRRHFMTAVEREWARSRRYGVHGALLLIDVDHFKRVNDGRGHLCGDALLREIARVSADSLRQADVLARFGGEEFIIYLPSTDPLGALDVAERIRQHVAALRLQWEGVATGATVSIGVASLGPLHGSVDALIGDADAALYQAKEAGRNCVRAAPVQPRPFGAAQGVTSS